MLHRVLRRVTVAAMMAAGLYGFAAPAYAQVSNAERKEGHNQHATRERLTTYEDREIKVVIPRGWRIVQASGAKAGAGEVALGKASYTLRLAYHTEHASGIEGGRIVEAFDIPWPGIDDAWTCAVYLREDPQPASRHLIFINLIVDTGDEDVRKNCAIPKELGSWSEKDGRKEYDYGDRRWFGGYFRTEYGGYFFGGNEDGCGLKAYTLISQAKTPERLPIADIANQNNNPELTKIIQEAIDIVNSIQYKRCAPF